MRHAQLAVIVLPVLVVSAAVLMPSTARLFGVTVVTAAQDAAAVEAALGLDRPTRRLVQQGLRSQGFDPGMPDGLFGPRTRAAIGAWQAARNEPQTGFLVGDQAAVLLAAAGPRPVTASSEPRDPTPVVDAPASLEISDAGLPTVATVALTVAQSSKTPDTAAPPAADSSAAPVTASRPGELPPEILIDRRLIRVDRLLARDDYRAAHDVMNEIVALRREHALALAPDFSFQYAQVAFAAGLAETAVASLNEYLLTAGRDGAFYREALELLESAEEAIRRADAERRRAEAARQLAEEQRRRAAARQRENDEFARRQAEAAAVTLRRDPLRSGGMGPEMVRMPTGRFQYVPLGRSLAVPDDRLGTPWVSIDRPFAIGKYEVTRAEFARFSDRSRYRTEAERSRQDVCIYRDNRRLRTWRQPGFSQTDPHPVVCVTILDAMAYAEWLSRETGHIYRLPSPAEWQYAARAGSEEAMLHMARGERNNCGRGNLQENPEGIDRPPACADGVEQTAEVGSFLPNFVGLHDMIGNVSEWVLACGHPIPIPNTNAVSPRSDGAAEDPRTCDRHFAAGGGFSDYPYAWYAMLRTNYYHPADETIGFRVLRELDEDEAPLALP